MIEDKKTYRPLTKEQVCKAFGVDEAMVKPTVKMQCRMSKLLNTKNINATEETK